MSNEEYPQWEHKEIGWGAIRDDIRNGNLLGKEGWEVAASEGSSILLKRRVRPKPSYNPSYGR